MNTNLGFSGIISPTLAIGTSLRTSVQMIGIVLSAGMRGDSSLCGLNFSLSQA